MSQDILIIVDCQKPLTNGQLPSEAVKMFAADSSIVRKNSQGSTELWVQVPPETNLRWRAVPLQLSQGLPEGQKWQVMITQVRLWGPKDGQLDARKYLQQWIVDAGTANGPAYSSATQSLTFSSPASDGSSLSNPAGVEIQKITDPFVQAICVDEMDSANDCVAYSFVCTVYQNGKQYATVTWDPYVTILST